MSWCHKGSVVRRIYVCTSTQHDSCFCRRVSLRLRGDMGTHRAVATQRLPDIMELVILEEDVIPSALQGPGISRAVIYLTSTRGRISNVRAVPTDGTCGRGW